MVSRGSSLSEATMIAAQPSTLQQRRAMRRPCYKGRMECGENMKKPRDMGHRYGNGSQWGTEPTTMGV